jgi:hypothetical protein
MPKRPTTKKKRRAKTKPPLTPPAPLWVPNDADLELMPQEVQQAVTQIIQPVYERFVIASDDPLEKSLGVTVTHLLWLEILQQADLKREYTEITAVLGTAQNHGQDIDQHLRIIESKVKVGYLLTRIRELRQRWNHHPADFPALPDPAAPTAIDVESTPAPDRDPAETPNHPTRGPNHGKTPPC